MAVVDKESDVTEEETSVKVLYHVMTPAMKWTMVVLLTCAGFWSSLGSPIYYPALKQLEKQFHVNAELINLTVVVYFIFQGLAPAVSGILADVYGRRPVILASMIIYIFASLGLALSQNYATVMVLRCLQSIGISPVVTINSGTVGDFTLKTERGTFVGSVSALTLMGQAFGSLIGSGLASTWKWRAIFWFLVIGCGSCFLLNFIMLVETKRTIAGNGSVEPRKWYSKAPVLQLPYVRRLFHYDNPDLSSLEMSTVKFDLTSTFKILSHPEIILFLLPAGLSFAMWTLSLTSISSELSIEPYNYPLAKIGLCYLPSGIGGLIGSFTTGRIIDIYYKKCKREFNEKAKEGERFNTMMVRLIPAIPQNILSVVSYTLFGWCMDKGLHISSILITSFVSSFCAMSTLSTCSTLLVDLYPTKSSTATGCYNLVRCLLAAIFMACFESMKRSLTLGGTFTLISGFVFISNFVMFIPMKYGMDWREKRHEKKLQRRSVA